MIENGEGKDMVIVNALGQVVKMVKRLENDGRCNVTALKTGVYFIKIDSEVVRFVKK